MRKCDRKSPRNQAKIIQFHWFRPFTILKRHEKWPKRIWSISHCPIRLWIERIVKCKHWAIHIRNYRWTWCQGSQVCSHFLFSFQCLSILSGFPQELVWKRTTLDRRTAPNWKCFGRKRVESFQNLFISQSEICDHKLHWMKARKSDRWIWQFAGTIVPSILVTNRNHRPTLTAQTVRLRQLFSPLSRRRVQRTKKMQRPAVRAAFSQIPLAKRVSSTRTLWCEPKIIFQHASKRIPTVHVDVILVINNETAHPMREVKVLQISRWLLRPAIHRRQPKIFSCAITIANIITIGQNRIGNITIIIITTISITRKGSRSHRNNKNAKNPNRRIVFASRTSMQWINRIIRIQRKLNTSAHSRLVSQRVTQVVSAAVLTVAPPALPPHQNSPLKRLKFRSRGIHTRRRTMWLTHWLRRLPAGKVVPAKVAIQSIGDWPACISMHINQSNNASGHCLRPFISNGGEENWKSRNS